MDTVSVDGAVIGEWSSSCDSTAREGNYARYYSFTLSEESAVTISLESSTDPYLYLRAGEAKSGAYLYENDDVDPGTDTNSEIEATLGAGIYTIEATTYSAGGYGELHPDRRRLVAVREFETEKSDVGPAEYETHTRESWYYHVALGLLDEAFLSQ